MQNQMRSLVYGSSFASVDGKEYITLYTGQDCNDTKRIRGIEIMKMGTTAEVFQSLPTGVKYPIECELTFEVRSAGQNKIAMFCTSIVPVRAPAPTAKAAS